MDVDWCLSCERKLDNLPAVSGPYCSPECLSYAQPSSSIRAHPNPLLPSGAYRIREWAQAIPPHIPAGAPVHPFADSRSPSPIPAERPPSPRSRTQPTPKLIERTSASTPLPTLCVSSPTHVRPLPPSRASSRTYAQPTTTPNTMASMSEASTSLTSLLTEPMVATPDEDHSLGAHIGALVRSWVNRDRASSIKSTKEDLVIEKVTDYFPSLPRGKKRPSPSSRKLKKTHSPSPTSSVRHVPSAKKTISSAERDRSTPTHHHTPTPVVFPSCRAAEPSWVDDDDDDDLEIIAPQPRHVYQKFEPPQQFEHHLTRAPSISSVSSTGSSVLFMAPKQWDRIRGRKDGRAIEA